MGVVCRRCIVTVRDNFASMVILAMHLQAVRQPPPYPPPGQGEDQRRPGAATKPSQKPKPFLREIMQLAGCGKGLRSLLPLCNLPRKQERARGKKPVFKQGAEGIRPMRNPRQAFQHPAKHSGAQACSAARDPGVEPEMRDLNVALQLFGNPRRLALQARLLCRVRR